MVTAPHHRILRRAATLLVVLAVVLVPLNGLATAQSSGSQSYVAVQDGECIPLTSFSGDESARTFYDYRLPDQFANNPYINTTGDAFGSVGTTALQRPNTSVVFVYTDTQGTAAEGDDTNSLVFVHGAQGNESSTGGAATFDITGLPADGEWTVRDDDYDDPTNVDNWTVTDTRSVVDWVWSDASTDGGVFSGLGDDSTVVVQPAFNDAATLSSGTDGTVEQWQALSNGTDDVTRTQLDLDEPLLITAGSCGDGGDGGGDDGGDGADGGDDDIDCPPGTVPRTVEIPVADSGAGTTETPTGAPGQNGTPTGQESVTATICVNETPTPTPTPNNTTPTPTPNNTTPTPAPTSTPTQSPTQTPSPPATPSATPVGPAGGPDTPGDDGTPGGDGVTPEDGDGTGDGTEGEPSGADGADGADGANGADGADGANGADGADGANGGDGADGANDGDSADSGDGADGGDGDGGDEPNGENGAAGDDGGDGNGGGGDGGDGNGDSN